MDFWIVTGATVHRLIHEDLAGCVRVVEKAYLTHFQGSSVNPSSHFLRFPDRPEARIIALPATIGGDVDVSGIKWIASYPGNVRQQLPRASAVLILNRTDNGYPFACLEASVISAARTAASSVRAAEALNAGVRATKTLGIVGTGFIARYVYNFLLSLDWEIDKVYLFDSDPAEANRFASTVCRRERHREVAVAPDLTALLHDSDIILFATSAGAPHVHDLALFSHNPIVLHLSLRDLSPEIILGAFNITDDVDHVLNGNTSLHLVQQATGDRSFIAGTLAEVLLGKCQVARSRPVIFSPFGLGILDLAVGKWVFERARDCGEAMAVPGFFFDMTR